MPTDLGTFSFLWERSANTDFSDTPVTLQDSASTTYLLTDDDAAAFIRVTVSYTDGGGFSETITSAVRQTETLPDREPTGAPVITGTTDAGQTLTVTTDTIGDANGLGDLYLPVGTQCQYRLQRYACHTTRLNQHHLSAHR